MPKRQRRSQPNIVDHTTITFICIGIQILQIPIPEILHTDTNVQIKQTNLLELAALKGSQLVILATNCFNSNFLANAIVTAELK
jgi:hypothetical protein